MVEIPGRSPGRERRWRWPLQVSAGRFPKRLEGRAARATVEVSEDSPGWRAAQGLRHRIQLLALIRRAKTEVKARNGQVVLAGDFRDETATSGDTSG